MAATILEQALKKHVNESMADDPYYAAIVCQFLGKMSAGFYESEYVDMVFQNHWPSFDIYDADVFMNIHAQLVMGGIAWAKIEVGHMPSKNNQVDENNRKLSFLPSPFEAKFIPEVGGGADCDGYFTWNFPVGFGIHNPDTDTWTRKEFGPRTLPLEVGTTASYRTLGHFASERGLARWAYGSAFVDAFILLDNNLWTVELQN